METQAPHAPARLPPDTAPARQASSARCVEIDWLRTIVVFATIPFHAVPVIGAQRTVFLVSAESNPELAVLGGFVLTWGIPLLFLLAGAATRFALDVRSPGRYVRERLVRLAPPLLLMVFVFAPLQLYFILRSNPDLATMGQQFGLQISVPQPERLGDIRYFYEQYLTFLITSVRGYSPTIGSLVLAHLWFVPRLLVVSLIGLPLLLYLRGRGRRVAERITEAGAHPVVLLFVGALAPAVLVTLLQTGWLSRFTEGWIFTDDWPNFFLDLVIFLYGYLIYTSLRLRGVVRAQAVPALVVGGLSAGIMIGLTLSGHVPAIGYSLASLLFVYVQTLTAWLIALGLLGLAMRYLTVSTPLQRYLTDAAFPVFVLHGPLLTISAYSILQVPIPGIVQALLIFAITVVGAFGIYEYVVRRTPVTRFLFGAKPPRTAKANPMH